MKLAILGATGPSGLQLVQRALDSGHSVVALVRNPEKFGDKYAGNEKFSAVIVDIFNSETMVEAMKGCDAVMSCLGVHGMSFRKITMYSESIKTIVGAMEKAGVRRLVAITSWATESRPDNPKFLEWILKPLAIGRHLSDMAVMEHYLAEQSDKIDFTCVRPPGLDDTPGTDREIRALPDAQWVPPRDGEKKVWTISRSDVARFMLSLLTCPDKSNEFNGKCVAIGYCNLPPPPPPASPAPPEALSASSTPTPPTAAAAGGAEKTAENGVNSKTGGESHTPQVGVKNGDAKLIDIESSGEAKESFPTSINEDKKEESAAAGEDAKKE